MKIFQNQWWKPIHCRSLRPKDPAKVSSLPNSVRENIIGSAEQAEITDSGLIDFLHSAAFILECIVANPALYDRKHEHYHNEPTKFQIWNGICVVHYEKRE